MSKWQASCRYCCNGQRRRRGRPGGTTWTSLGPAQDSLPLGRYRRTWGNLDGDVGDDGVHLRFVLTGHRPAFGISPCSFPAEPLQFGSALVKETKDEDSVPFGGDL